ncbi:MAG: MoaD/ThiS family protein [Robiginitomaculum sp.]|nr:MoaD/ThiS family protein [Robiginitomaculum sp.]
MVKILYFGRLSERVGTQEEHIDLPDNIRTITELKAWLNTYHQLDGILDHDTVKTMIDQSLNHKNSSIIGAVEIGFLPPVGGG